MVEIKEKYNLQRCLCLAQDFLGIAVNWNSCCQNVEPPSSELLIVIYSDHKILTDLIYWNKFVIFVNDKYFNKQVYF